MPQTIKAEQTRFSDYAEIYFTSSEELSADPATLINAQTQETQGAMQHEQTMQSQKQQHQQQMGIIKNPKFNPHKPIGGAPQEGQISGAASANKTIASRTTRYGDSKVSKTGMKTLKGKTNGK